MKLPFRAVGLAAFFLTMIAPYPAHAQTEYHVTVDTSTIVAQNGFLDFQFNPGSDALSATVSFSNFASDGTLAATSENTGGVFGSLPSAFIANSAGYNDLFQGITYGDSISFDMTFSGPALHPGSSAPITGSVFAMSLYDATGSTPLLTNDPVGTILDVYINPDGTTSVTNFPSDDNGGSPVANATPTSPVPEASTIISFGLLLALGLGATAVSVRRRKAQSQ